MDENNSLENSIPEENVPMTKKEKADSAGRDVAEVAARGAGKYFGGTLGGAAVDAALKTKAGQKVIGRASKQINKNPLTRHFLAKNQENISKVKPLANSVMDGIGKSGSFNGSNLSKDNLLDKDNLSNDNDEKINGTGNISGVWKKVPFKGKIIVISVVSSLVFLMIFLIIFITPLMELGIIDISGSGTSSSSGQAGFTQVTENSSYWWPIGSSSTTVIGGKEYAIDEPSPASITSPYGYRMHPIHNVYKLHNGVDIADGTAYGVTNIIASSDGTVIATQDGCVSSGNSDSTCGGGWGNFVKIQHADGNVTLYAHLYEGSLTVSVNDTVKQGQLIGKMGSSGFSTGTHLHFTIYVNGDAVDPLNYIDINNPRPSSNKIVHINGASNKQSVCLTLKSNGMPDNGVAAVMTNMNHESGFRTEVLGDNGTSYGLCQWHNSRYDNLRNSFPDSYNTVGSQIEFLMYELKNSFSYVYNGLYDGTSSAYDLTYDFCYHFEVPSNKETKCKDRASNSNSFLRYVQNGCQED